MKPFGCPKYFLDLPGAIPTTLGVVCDIELTYFRFMKHISIIVPKGAILGSLEGPRMLFSEVNDLLQRIGKTPLFKVQLVGLSNETPVYNGMYNIYSDELVKNIDKTDLIIIPALAGNPQQTAEENKDFVPWIIKQHNKGAEVASLCVGAFLLAATGLIKGKQCATHWMAANDFRKTFPDVILVEDKIITDENGIYSSGGAFSYLNLILYLIEKYAGRDIAVFCSKAFQIDIDRNSQSPFIMFKGQKDHEDEPIKKAQEFIESNFDDKISVDQLASMFALGRRNLERRFKKATSNTVVEYIQRVKIEAAKMSLESSRENVNEVMYKVGYTDTKAFRTTFKKFTGLSPVQYRNKYNRDLREMLINDQTA
jgi:transcriptional regulator GlxA family with amidase domain